MAKTHISDVMTATLETAQESDSLRTVAERMVKANVGAIPVCGKGGVLRGMITDRDIVVRAVAVGRDPATTTVGEIETTKVTSVAPDDPVERAIDIMSTQQVRRVPVIEHNSLVGMVSQADIARHLSAKDVGHVVGDISKG